jgi:streptogramin lyase
MRSARIAMVVVAAGSAATISAALGVIDASAATAPIITTVTFTAPTGATLDNPEGVAWGPNWTLYVANTADNVLSAVTGATTTTVAGSYEGTGETGDNGPAIAATLTEPAGLAVNDAGDVFIADTEDNVIREVTPAGVIKRVAGTGAEGYSGDGGRATRAELDSPQAVAVNRDGDLFIADTGNNVIREVSPRGTITTFAGDGRPGYVGGDDRRATSARLTAPTGVAVDAFGNVYIADTGNNVIRRVSTSGLITTVAGNYAEDLGNDGIGGFSGDGGAATAAQLYAPEGVAVDNAGDLFIADTFNDAIREVTPNGIITTVVNSAATPGKTGYGGPATAAALNSPYAVSVDNSTGDLYIADTSNNAIRVVTGLPVPSLVGPGPLAPRP